MYTFIIKVKCISIKSCLSKQNEIDVYFKSLIPPRGDNKTKYGNPAKLLFIINANLATLKITIGGIRDLKYTLTGTLVYSFYVCDCY